MPIGFDEIQVEKAPTGTIVTLRIKGKLDKDDYAQFVPMIECQMQNASPVRLLVELHDFIRTAEESLPTLITVEWNVPTSAAKIKANF